MNINIKATQVDLTPALREYIEEKMESVAKMVSRWSESGNVEAYVEVARTSKHHLKGEVFYAEVNIRLPHQLLRAEATDADIRAAIDEVKDVLHREIERYKDKELSQRRQGRSKDEL